MIDSGRVRPPHHLISKRGHKIIYTNSAMTDVVVTVELAEKWYGLILVPPESARGWEPMEVSFPDGDGVIPSFVDHVPNPVIVKLWAEKMNYYLDEIAYELMVGRWEIEVRGAYI